MADGIILAAPGGVQFTYRPLYYYSTPGHAVGSKALAQNIAYYSPFVVYTAQTFDRMALEVTVAGGAGSVIGLGVYRNTGGAPGALVIDAGTIDGTSVTPQEITGLTISLSTGVYWIASSCTGNASAPTVRALTGSPMLAFCGHLANNGNYSATGYYGAGTNPLSTTTPASSTTDSSFPRVMLRAALSG